MLWGINHRRDGVDSHGLLLTRITLRCYDQGEENILRAVNSFDCQTNSIGFGVPAR